MVRVLSFTCFTSSIDVDDFMQVVRVRFMKEIVSNGDDFELYELFDLKPIMRFECSS